MKTPRIEDYPAFIIVGDSKYHIKWTNSYKTLGECDDFKQRIKLSRKQSKDELFSTFLHECLHAIEFEMGLHIKHKVIYKLERGLAAFMRDNVEKLGLKRSKSRKRSRA